MEILDQYIGFVFRNPEPFLEQTLQTALTQQGFSLPPRLGPGLVISIGRPPIAVRADSRVSYDPDVATLTASAVSTPVMIETFRTLQLVLETELLPRWRELSRGIEFSIVARVTTDRIPLRTISGYARGLDLTRLSGLFGASAGLFTLRLFPMSVADTNENLKMVPDWFEMTIEPQVTNPIAYFVRLIYRKIDLERTVSFAEAAQTTIMQSIGILEG